MGGGCRGAWGWGRGEKGEEGAEEGRDMGGG